MGHDTNSIFYLIFILLLAYAPYKPNQKKLFIGASGGYALFVSVWFSVFIGSLLYPAISYIPMNHVVDWVFPFITILWFLSPYVIRKFGHEPNIALSDKPARLLIRFEPKMFLTKYFEILFQQSMFVYILFVLLRGFTYWNTIAWFIVIIGLIHLGNFPFTGRKDTLFYFYLSLPMAALFGALILNGYICIAVAIHMIFYLLFNGRYWFVKSSNI